MQRIVILRCSCMLKLVQNTAASEATAVSGKGVGRFMRTAALIYILGLWGNCRTATEAEVPTTARILCRMPWQSAPTRHKGSSGFLTPAHVYLCSNGGLWFDIVISNSICFPANGSISFFSIVCVHGPHFLYLFFCW